MPKIARLRSQALAARGQRKPRLNFAAPDNPCHGSAATGLPEQPLTPARAEKASKATVDSPPKQEMAVGDPGWT